MLGIATQTLLLALALCQVRVSWQMQPCGDRIRNCLCDRTRLSCSLKTDNDRVKNLAELLSDGGGQGIVKDPLELINVYINCFLRMSNQRLTREMLRPFKNLRSLEIIRCNLTEIDSDALADLKHLDTFDVSGNKLSRIPPRLFNGLTLTSVKFSLNPGLILDEESFAGSKIQTLVVSECDIVEFPLASIINIQGLRSLTLSSNKIRIVPKAALNLIRGLSSFYIYKNPLLCTCQNKWLRESLDWTRLVPFDNSITRKTSKLPTCEEPLSLNGIEVSNVDPEMFACLTPHVGSVRLLVDGQRASLDCKAWLEEAEERRSLTWTMLPDVGVRSRSGEHFSATLAKRQAVDKYVVSVHSAGGKNSSLNLTVRWPEELKVRPDEWKESPTPPLLDSTKVVAGGGGSGHLRTDYFAQKQFTLVDIIVAVIGTFMATTLVFLLSCQFTRWYSRRDKKRRATYGSHPYSATYNQHPASSHEYDVPRIDQPCLTKAQHSAEFLDFNNPRVMYNM